ncbi:MAG: VRR-NUC domain-containing protein [Mogibacterium sp.]|nr:VRR-NUC domain-containing protein [Mogibacterium sp.]
MIIWSRLSQGKYPELALLHHIPNGGSRSAREGAKLKQMGVLAGVPDLHLPVPRGCYCGLYIEMKFGSGQLSADQRRFLRLASEQGNYCCVCYTSEDAISVLQEYLACSIPALDSAAMYTGRRDLSHPSLSIYRGGKVTAMRTQPE